MKTWMKYTALICCGVLVIGLVLMGVGYVSGAKLALNLKTNGIQIAEDKTKKIMEYQKLDASYDKVILNIEMIDLEIVPSGEYGIEAVYYDDNQKPVVASEKGILNISNENATETLSSINLGFNFINRNEAQVKLYVPREKTKEVEIKGGYGDVNAAGIDVDTLSIERTTSDINLSEITAKNVTIRNSYGDIVTKKIQAQYYDAVANTCEYDVQDVKADELKLENSYGKVTMKNIQSKNCSSSSNTSGYELYDVTADKLNIYTSYGNIEGSGLKTNGCSMDVNTGDVMLNGALKGKNEIKTSYGKARINTSLKKEDYSYRVNVSYGEIRINDDRLEEEHTEQENNSANQMVLSVSTGDAELMFGK